MLSLDSPEWSKLQHAYGSAGDIPALLRQLTPQSESGEPWSSLWSALAHQGDVYTASFAAVPHILRVLETAPLEASETYFKFVAWIEICRRRNEVQIPPEYIEDYFRALGQLPALIAATAGRAWNADFLRAALAALAAVKGSTSVSEACLELSPEVATEFSEWLFER